jgi:hypothetical protein
MRSKHLYLKYLQMIFWTYIYIQFRWYDFVLSFAGCGCLAGAFPAAWVLATPQIFQGIGNLHWVPEPYTCDTDPRDTSRRRFYRDAKTRLMSNTASRLAQSSFGSEFKWNLNPDCLPSEGVCEETESLLKKKSYYIFIHFLTQSNS